VGILAEMLLQWRSGAEDFKYSRFSCNTIVAFLENTALWKNRVIETIGSIGIKGLRAESSNSPSRMYYFYSISSYCNLNALLLHCCDIV
jgi:hypothetical protein